MDSQSSYPKVKKVMVDLNPNINFLWFYDEEDKCIGILNIFGELRMGGDFERNFNLVPRFRLSPTTAREKE